MLEKVFKLKENHTDVKTEILAGITTFMTMAYILAVNPSIHFRSGYGSGGSLYCNSTCITDRYAVYGSICKLPFALAPGMGLNAYFAYTVVIGMNYSWQICTDCSICRGYYLHYSFTDECQEKRSSMRSQPVLRQQSAVGYRIIYCISWTSRMRISLSEDFYSGTALLRRCI